MNKIKKIMNTSKIEVFKPVKDKELRTFLKNKPIGKANLYENYLKRNISSFTIAHELTTD